MLAGTELRTAPRVTATKRASVPQLARVVQRAWHNGPRATVVVEIFSWNGGGITALQQEMLITSTITQSDYSHLHKNVSYLLRDLGAEYPMYLYHHKTRFKFIFLIKQNPNRQCRLADEKIFWSRCLRTFRSNSNFVRDDTKSQKLFRQTDRCLSVVFRIGNVTKTKIPHKIDKTFKYAFSPYVANVTWQLAARIGIYIFAWIIFRFFTK